ncbi:MAG: hypothetical protein QME52_14120, partial [Bacteroidota bacterium]|nr:hypothetical protein [Bacteroidota bacterium]
HYRLRLPYPSGYFTNTIPSNILYSTKQIRNWYKAEENKTNGKGRWIDGDELRYGEAYSPGINAPCGGMYQQLEGYDTAKHKWLGSGNAHSQLIDSVVVHRDHDGHVSTIDVRVVEGNVTRDYVDQGNGRFRRSWIRNTKWYRDVKRYTTQGALFDGTGTVKIRGWGVMEFGGDPYCFNEVLYDPG